MSATYVYIHDIPINVYIYIYIDIDKYVYIEIFELLLKCLCEGKVDGPCFTMFSERL